MFLLNKIKYNADIKYDVYEQKVEEYYKTSNKFFSKNLENYIYKFYIQSHLSGVFYNDKNDNICDVLKYVRNLYTTYYNYYIKDIINDGRHFIVTQEIIDKFLKETFFKQNKIYNWIQENCDIDVSLDCYIEDVLRKKTALPIFQRYGGVEGDDLYVFMAKFLDFIVNDNMEKIILSIAMGNV